MALATRPKRNTTAHKKRGGKHHRRSDSYLKHYWPYIPMLLIVGLGLIFNTVWSQSAVLGATSDFSSSALLDTSNQHRSQNHETTLKLNQQLSAAAQAKANDMATRNYWSHDTPDDQAPASFVTNAGYNYQITGENLAYGFADAKEAVAGWMNSPAHRANLLNNKYQDVGFGVAQSANYQGEGPTTIVVAEYGTPAGVTLGASQSAVATGGGAAPAQSVSRIQLLTGQPIWITAAVSALAGAAAALFIVRHGVRFKRLALEGEHFITNRPLLDIGLVFVGTLAVIFVQASGTIH
jgi:uncharacterized protein YkwD